jgi:hypothetical protein
MFAPLKLTAGLTLGAVKPTIAQKLGLDEAAIARAKIFEGQRWVLFAPDRAMKDTDLLDELEMGDTLYVVANPKRKGTRWRQREEAIKIEN